MLRERNCFSSLSKQKLYLALSLVMWKILLQWNGRAFQALQNSLTSFNISQKIEEKNNGNMFILLKILESQACQFFSIIREIFS